MELEKLLSISAGVSTIIGVYYAYKAYRKTASYQSKISCAIIKRTNFYNEFKKEFSNLQVNHGGTEIQDPRYTYLRISIINSGSTDILKEDLFEPLQVDFGGNVEIIDCKISLDKNHIVDSMHCNDSKQALLCKLNSMKSKEFFNIDIILMTGYGNSFDHFNKENFKFRARNANKSVEFITFQKPKKKSETFLSYLTFLSVGLVSIIFFESTIVEFRLSDAETSQKYFMENGSSKNEVYLRLDSDTVFVCDASTNNIIYKEDVKFFNYSNLIKVEVFQTSRKNNKFSFLFIAVASLLLCICGTTLEVYVARHDSILKQVFQDIVEE